MFRQMLLHKLYRGLIYFKIILFFTLIAIYDQRVPIKLDLGLTGKFK